MALQDSEVYGSVIDINDPEPNQHHQRVSLNYLDKKEELRESQVSRIWSNIWNPAIKTGEET